MRIFVTGSSGFIGSHLASELEADGHDVYALRRYISGERYCFWKPTNEVHGDLKDREQVREVLQKIRPQVTFHLAAITPVSYSFKNPTEVVDVNYLGTVNLAHACMDAGVEKFIVASSSEVYGLQKKGPLKEDMPLWPISPYAASKIAVEDYLRMMERVYGFPAVIMRPFNSYGGALARREYFVLEKAMIGALKEGKIQLFDPAPIRDFLFRDDHVKGYLNCLESTKCIGETINLCTGEGISIGEAARKVAKIAGELTGKNVEVSFENKSDRMRDIPLLVGDNTKARVLLDWKPEYTLEMGLRKALKEWYIALQLIG